MEKTLIPVVAMVTMVVVVVVMMMMTIMMTTRNYFTLSFKKDIHFSYPYCVQ